MDRRRFLASLSGVSAAALLPEAGAQSGSQITHVDTKKDGSPLESRVVKIDGIRAEGAAPGAKA